MLRLSLVFVVLMASTATPVEQLEAELQESVERDGYHDRRLTNTNVRTILRGDECAGAQSQ